MPRSPRSAVRKPARSRGTSAAQLQFDFATGASLEPPVRPIPLEREMLARAFERIAKDENDALLAAAVRRLRGRSILWTPPLHSLAPKALVGRRLAKAGRERNDAAMEWAGMKLMGYRLH